MKSLEQQFKTLKSETENELPLEGHQLRFQRKLAQHNRKGNGFLVTKERSIEHFDALKVSGSFNVEMTSSRKNQLSIYNDENLIEDIITEVKDGTLIIRTKKNS